jgi:hypothetical protein
VGPEGLRHLHGQGADAASRADHEHALPGLHLRDVADRLEVPDELASARTMPSDAAKRFFCGLCSTR